MTNKGYGTLSYEGASMLAHLAAYAVANGPVDDALQIDHQCRVRLCVNPNHLRAVTPKQNSENHDPAGHGTSGVRGVSWSKAAKKWETYATHNGRRYYAGIYVSIDDAERAVVALRNRLFTNNVADH